MKITSLFSTEALNAEALASGLLNLQDITLKANGQSVAGILPSEIEQLVLDFIDIF